LQALLFFKKQNCLEFRRFSAFKFTNFTHHQQEFNMKTARFLSLSAISALLMAVLAFSLVSCEDKKEDPAAREARREARREAQKEEIKKELQAEASAKQAAEEAQRKAEVKQKVEADFQRLKAEQAKIEADLPNVQRRTNRIRAVAERDRLDAEIAAKDASGLFASGKAKDKAKLQKQKAANSAMEAEVAVENLNSLHNRLDEIKKQEAAAAKKLQSLQ
jgi:chromosome segregation ATPase